VLSSLLASVPLLYISHLIALDDLIIIISCFSRGVCAHVRTDLVVSRNSMLALWMYLMKYIDQISVLKFQELAYRMIRALLMRKEVNAQKTRVALVRLFGLS